jgi:Fe-S-cluster containining protein
VKSKENSLDKPRLDRHSKFYFSCKRCLTCCRFKSIQLNPFEIARLATNRGISTTQFIKNYTIANGTFLQNREDGTCVFLDDKGCTVHPDRPLVCRLYPLGRYVDFLGVEEFAQLELEHGCKGTVRDDGRIVEHYLGEQDAIPFMHAADRYLDLLWNLLEILKEQESNPMHNAVIATTVKNIVIGNSNEQATSWIDMDFIVDNHCNRYNNQIPVNLTDKMELHIEVVRNWLT